MSLETPAGRATVTMVCALFSLSRQAYYAAKQALRDEPGAAPPLEVSLAVVEPTPPTDAQTALETTAATVRAGVTAEAAYAAIEAIVGAHPAWGVRKVWATMRREPYGLKLSLRRVWSLMRAKGLCLPPDRSHRVPVTAGHVSVEEPNRRWATDLTTVWTEEDGLVAVVPVVDCGCRSALAVVATKPQDAAAVLDPVRTALAIEFEAPPDVPADLELRTDHGPQYTAQDCIDLCLHWRLDHTYAPVGRPTGNSVAERLIRTMKEECIWLRDWRSIAELQAALDDWRTTYNEARPHQALQWQTPAERRRERLGEMRLAA